MNRGSTLARLVAAGGALLACMACKDGGGDAVPDAGIAPPEPPREVVTRPADLRRLTRYELVRSLRHVVGVKVSVEETEQDLVQAGLGRVGANVVTTSRAGVEQNFQAIERALDRVFDDAAQVATLVACADDHATPGCTERFVRRLGLRAWRRPLTEPEVRRYVALQARCADRAASYDASLRCVAAALLHSPYFQYRVELPTDGVFKGYAMASRLSYFLWSQPPDGALLDAAAAGDLDTAEGVRAAATRMLASPLAREGLATFVDEWFRTDRLARLSRDVVGQTHEDVQFRLGKEGTLQDWFQKFPSSAAEELRRMIVGHVFDDDGDYLDLLTTDRTYVDQHLEDLYNLGADEQGPKEVGSEDNAPRPRIFLQEEFDEAGFARARHAPSSERRGLLGTLAVLGQLGKQNETSPTRRGLFAMQRVLCLDVASPPDNVDICERPSGVSRRESLEKHHLCTPACAGCHRQMDPVGFALDSFDTIGRYRITDDWRFPLDTEVTWSLVNQGETRTLQFSSLRTMADTFKAQPEASACVTRQMYRFATGHHEQRTDEAALRELTDEFVSGERKLKAFLLKFVASDAFRKPPRVVSYQSGPVSFQRVLDDVLTARCSPCHVAESLGALSFRGDDVEARLAAPSVGLPSMPLVTPGDPQNSYLWRKVTGTHREAGGPGERMPPAQALAEDELALIRQWIEEQP